MQLFLHIGTNKTGTTTLQSLMSLNRGRLKKSGVFYPRCAGHQNHLKLAAACLDTEKIDNVRRGLGLTSRRAIERFRHSLVEDLSTEASTWPSNAKIVFSNEHLMRLVEQSEKRRLYTLVSKVTSNIKVIIYLRRQDAFFASEYSQKVKGGRSIHFDPRAKVKASVYDYSLILDQWAAEFGQENIIVRPFEREQFLDHDLIADFRQLVQIAPDTELKPALLKNASLDAQTVEFLRLANTYLSRWSGDKTNRARDKLVAALEQISDGPKIGMAAPDAKAFYARFEEGNRLVASKFLGRAGGLFMKLPGDDDGEAPSLSAMQAVEIASRLLGVSVDGEPSFPSEGARDAQTSGS